MSKIQIQRQEDFDFSMLLCGLLLPFYPGNSVFQKKCTHHRNENHKNPKQWNGVYFENLNSPEYLIRVS